MAITLKRQLDDGEKQKILEQHGRVCFATGHPIADGEALHFDHIRAFAHDGASELDNIAPMCEVHNKQKGTLPLEDFRVTTEAIFFRGRWPHVEASADPFAEEQRFEGFRSASRCPSSRRRRTD